MVHGPYSGTQKDNMDVIASVHNVTATYLTNRGVISVEFFNHTT